MKKIVLIFTILFAFKINAFALSEYENAMFAINGATDQCNKGQMITCYHLGKLYSVGMKHISQDTKKSNFYYNKACNDTNAAGCYALAEAIATNPKLRDFNMVKKYLITSCKNGYGIACRELGTMLAKGVGIPKDISNAIRYYRQGCNKNDAASCDVLKKLSTSGMKQ